MKYLQKPQLFALLSLLGVILLFFVYYVFFVFHITGTDPTTKNVATVSPYFKVNFNKELSSDNSPEVIYEELELNDDSQTIIKSVDVIGKSLYINFVEGSLLENTTYTLTIKEVVSKDGKVIENKSFKFTAKNIDTNKLSEEQQQKILENQGKYSPTKNDPILNYLPYGDTGFNITPVVKSDTNGVYRVTLDAEILLSRAELSNRTISVEKHKQELLLFIKSIGLDPSSYEINYSVTEPSIY